MFGCVGVGAEDGENKLRITSLTAVGGRSGGGVWACGRVGVGAEDRSRQQVKHRWSLLLWEVEGVVGEAVAVDGIKLVGAGLRRGRGKRPQAHSRDGSRRAPHSSFPARARTQRTRPYKGRE